MSDTPNTPAKHHTQTLQIKLNRLHSKKSFLDHQLKKASTSYRRARTRTLIQMGALLNLTDLPTLLGIEEGDDLQHDIHTMDKAAMLLGMILSLREHIPSTFSRQDLEFFKKIGIRHMKSKKFSSPLQGK